LNRRVSIREWVTKAIENPENKTEDINSPKISISKR
jgi:hypothetical protein